MSLRGGVWRKSDPKARGDEQAPDMRCGTLGTSGHVTVIPYPRPPCGKPVEGTVVCPRGEADEALYGPKGGETDRPGRNVRARRPERFPERD